MKVHYLPLTEQIYIETLTFKIENDKGRKGMGATLM